MTTAGEVRKTVTVLFCDVVGSTALGESADPEVLRAMLARYFERMKAIVDRHGGTVEKFIGDAVMAVFGLPVAHEDDALRAVRAAVEMRASWPELGISARVGITTGEVVAGTAERLATGDAVNVAARLQQAATPGDILCSDDTLRLAGDAVQVQPLPPLELKGKQAAVNAARVLSVTAIPAQRTTSDAPLLGRAQELGTLADAWQRIGEDARCVAITVLGAPGVGKSRLVGDFLSDVSSTVVQSRCLPYGEGITYWPVVGIVKQLDGYRRRLEPDAARSIEVLLGAVGTTSSDEIAWAVRKLLEVAAADQPLVVVIDDIQWGEEPFLDLLEHVALMATAPILLLCMARPELLDKRSDWSGVLRLEALSAGYARALLDDRLGGASIGDDTRTRILANAAGNPLFVEEMAAMLVAAPHADDVVVPPTIQALLTARLDQLDAAERLVLEHGAVEGEVFHRGVVHALTPDETRLMARLTSLVRRELVRPERPTLPSDDAFRFRHLLVRDAAYDSIAKSRKAILHERLGDWLERSAADLVELDEIAGYHFEQAHRYRAELGAPDRDLAEKAARHLAAAGKRALSHGDVGAAVNLLERAAALLPNPAADIRFEFDIGNALFYSGRLDECLAWAEAAEQSAVARGDRSAELFARIEKVATLYWQARVPADDVYAVCNEAIQVFEELGDEWGLMRAWGEIGAALTAREGQKAIDALERAIGYAERVGNEHFYLRTLEQLLSGAYAMGPTPVSQMLVWLRGRSNANLVRQQAWAEAALGNFDTARDLLANAYRRAEQMGDGFAMGATASVRSNVERMAGDFESALEYQRLSCAKFLEMEHNAWLASAVARLSLDLSQLGHDEEAAEWAKRAEEEAGENDLDAQQIWRLARAEVLVRDGNATEALRLAQEAVEMVRRTDITSSLQETLRWYADILERAGHDPTAVLKEMLQLYEAKENLVRAEYTRAQLARIGTPAR